MGTNSSGIISRLKHGAGDLFFVGVKANQRDFWSIYQLGLSQVLTISVHSQNECLLLALLVFAY